MQLRVKNVYKQDFLDTINSSIEDFSKQYPQIEESDKELVRQRMYEELNALLELNSFQEKTKHKKVDPLDAEMWYIPIERKDRDGKVLYQPKSTSASFFKEQGPTTLENLESKTIDTLKKSIWLTTRFALWDLVHS